MVVCVRVATCGQLLMSNVAVGLPRDAFAVGKINLPHLPVGEQILYAFTGTN